MGHEIHNSTRVQRVVSPVAVGTTGTGKTGTIVDRKGFGGVEFLIAYGTITATNAVFTATVFEGDATGSMTSAADADLLGTEALAGIAAGTPRTSAVNKNVTKKVGYKGIKRYVNVRVTSTITAGTPIGVDAVLFNPESVSALS